MSTIHSKVEELSDDEFTALLDGDSPEGTPGKKDLLGGTKQEKPIDTKVTKVEKPVETIKFDDTKSPSVDNLEVFEEEDATEPIEEKVEDKVEDVSKETKRGRPAKQESPVDYKAATDYLIEQGIWDDFDGRENLELTDKSFAELLQAQAENKANQALQDKVESLGVVAKQIIEFEKNGGNPQLIIEAFQEQKDIQSFDIDTEDGQEGIIREYYERAGKQKQWIDKQINLLKEQGEDALKEEAVENQKLIMEDIDESIQQTQAEQAQFEERRKTAELQFNRNLRQFIHSDNLAERDKKELEKFYFDHKYQLPNGQKVNELYKKWMEIQNDPKKYYQFVKWAFNPESFADTTETINKVNKKNFSFLRESQATNSKKTSADTEYQDKNNNKHKNPFSFKL